MSNKKTLFIGAVFLSTSLLGALIGWSVERNRFNDNTVQRIILRNTTIERSPDGMGFDLVFACNNIPLVVYNLREEYPLTKQVQLQNSLFTNAFDDAWRGTVSIAAYAAGSKSSEIRKILKTGFKKIEKKDRATFVKVGLLATGGALSGFMEGYIIARMREPPCTDATILDNLKKTNSEVWPKLQSDIFFNINQGIEQLPRTALTGLKLNLTKEDMKKLSRLNNLSQKRLEIIMEDFFNKKELMFKEKLRNLSRLYKHDATEEELSTTTAERYGNNLNHYLDLLSRLIGPSNIDDLIDVDDYERISQMMIATTIMVFVVGLLCLGLNLFPWARETLRMIVKDSAQSLKKYQASHGQ